MNSTARILVFVFCVVVGVLNLGYGNLLVSGIVFSLGLGNLFLYFKQGDPDSFFTLGAYLLFLLCAILGICGMLYSLRVFG